MIASSLLVSGPRSGPLVAVAVGCGVVTIFAIWRIGETRGTDLRAIAREQSVVADRPDAS